MNDPEELDDGTLELPCGTLWDAADLEGWREQHLLYCATRLGNFGSPLAAAVD